MGRLPTTLRIGLAYGFRVEPPQDELDLFEDMKLGWFFEASTRKLILQFSRDAGVVMCGHGGDKGDYYRGYYIQRDSTRQLAPFRSITPFCIHDVDFSWSGDLLEWTIPACHTLP